MKKMKAKILLSIMTLGLILSLAIFISLIRAQTSSDIIPGVDTTKIAQIGAQIQTPEAAKEAGTAYLKQELAKIIQDKAPFLAAFHAFLLEHQTIFKWILNREYGFTAAFFCVLALWIYLASFGTKIFNSLGIIEAKIGIAIGILLAIILAHTNGINWLVERALYVINAPAAWWMRAILWAVFIILFIAAVYFENMLKKSLEEAEKKAKEEKLEQKLKELEAESKGREEGRKITEPIRKMKKDLS